MRVNSKPTRSFFFLSINGKPSEKTLYLYAEPYSGIKSLFPFISNKQKKVVKSILIFVLLLSSFIS